MGVSGDGRVRPGSRTAPDPAQDPHSPAKQRIETPPARRDAKAFEPVGHAIGEPDQARVGAVRQAIHASPAAREILATVPFPMPEIHLRADGVVIVKHEDHARSRRDLLQAQDGCGQPFEIVEMHRVIGTGGAQEIEEGGLGRRVGELGRIAETVMGRGHDAGIDDLEAARAVGPGAVANAFPAGGARGDVMGDAGGEEDGLDPGPRGQFRHEIALIDRNPAAAPFGIEVIHPVDEEHAAHLLRFPARASGRSRSRGSSGQSARDGGNGRGCRSGSA